MTEVMFIVIIIFLIVIKSNISSKFKRLQSTIQQLNDKVSFLQQQLKKIKQPVFEKKVTVVEKEIKPIEKPITDVQVEKTPKESAVVNPISEKIIKPIIALKEEKTVKKAQEKLPPKKSFIERFKEKNPDLEKFIGENLINKVGVLILVLGISFFVKFAIDKDWINEPARVGIGVLCGALVMFIAHKLKKNYAAFSSVLVAGAISIFYLTIYIAFHEYQLFSQTVAFSIMAIITMFSCLVSVSYNRQELAVLSLIGGFAAPFLVSTGEGNYVVLFTYIAILNSGILAISYFKKWKIVTIVAFVLTTVLYAGWVVKELLQEDISHTGALTFATIFYFIFSLIIVLNNLRNKGVFSVIEYVILIANTFFFFGIGITILKDWESNYTGLFTLLLAGYNVIYAAVLFKKFGLDKNAVYLLIGLALTFVTLTIPIQFNGNQITIFWAAETVLLFWLSQKSKIKGFRLGAIVVQILSIISLLMDWKLYVDTADLSVVLNPLFIAGSVVSISLFLTFWLLKKESNISTKFFTLKISIYKTIVLVVTILTTYFTGFLEINYQAFQFLENTASALSFSVVYHFVFVAFLLFLVIKLNKKGLEKAVLMLGVVSIFLYITNFFILPINEITQNTIYSLSSKNAFYFHYIILACLVYFGVQIFRKLTVVFTINPKQTKWLSWIFIFAIVYIVSNEIMIHGVQFSDLTSSISEFDNGESDHLKYNQVESNLSAIKTQIIKIGYPILWGLFSFIFLIIGIKKQWKNLRIIALSLLGITIVKLFVYDIKNVSETGKIIAFILLGVLILIISFVYQKIKKLVVDENSENNDEKI